MQCVAVTGASGFVGSRFVQSLASQPNLEIRALTRRGKIPQLATNSRIAIVQGDIADASALGQLLRPNCTVMNFAYDPRATPEKNLSAASALAESCLNHRVRRVVHCSTAVVAGRTRTARIDEKTECHPRTDYEKTKLAIENLLRDRARGKFEITVLRPTAVIGPGGPNLLKMARDLTQRSPLTNYLRSCVNARRRLHLVVMDNVIAAAAFLLEPGRRIDQEIFIVSDDEAPENNFEYVEQYLMQAFGVPDYAAPRIKLPAALLSLLLRIRGRSLVRPYAVFASEKLGNFGFVKPVRFTAGLAAFAEWYKNMHQEKASAG